MSDDFAKMAKTIQGLLCLQPQTVRVYRDTFELDAHGHPRYHYDIVTADKYENGTITIRDGRKFERGMWDICPTSCPY